MARWLLRLLLAFLVLSFSIVSGLALAQGITGGKKTFDSMCTACHGPGGSGGAGPALNARRYGSDEIRTVVRQGLGFMPGFPASALSDAALDDLVVYVQSLSVPPVTPTPTPTEASTPAPRPTATPIPTSTETPAPTPTPTATPTETQVGTPTATPTRTARPTPTPAAQVATPTPTPTRTARPTPTPAAQVATPTPTPTPTVTPPSAANAGSTGGGAVTLRLDVPEQASSGWPLRLGALVKDDQGKPLAGVPVKFFAEVDFFGNGTMQIGEATTDEQGHAVLEYTPRLTGEVRVLARYNSTETAATIKLAESSRAYYRTRVGIRLPAFGPKASALLGPARVSMEAAPMTSARLPGGALSWLLLLAGTLAAVWATYSFVMYQVLRISGGTGTRVLPLGAIGLIVILGILLVLVIVTGPDTNLHAFR